MASEFLGAFDREWKESVMADGGMPLWQLALAGALNHGARQGIIKAIEYMRGLSEDDAREMIEGMSPDMAARFLNMWRASRDEPTIRGDQSGL